MRFGLSLPIFADPSTLVDVAVRAEASGWDGVFVWDHLHFRREMRLDVHDPWVLLGAMAQATQRVRLGTMVTPLARRRAHIVAKHVVTLDHLSHGRAVLGVGLGEPASDEFESFGDEGDDRLRGDRLDEALTVLDGLWTAEPFRFDGAHLHVDAELRPAPVQRPRPPIWAAVMSANGRPRRRALALDGVVPLGSMGPMPPAELASFLTALGERPPGWEVVASWADGHGPEAYADAGATWLIESRWPEGAWLEELTQAASNPPTAG